MTHDTGQMHEDDCVQRMPAEAATDVGYDAALPEGAAIAMLLLAAVLVCAVLLGVHLLTYLP